MTTTNWTRLVSPIKRRLIHWRVYLFFLIPLLLSPIPICLGTKSAKAGYILLISSSFLVLEIIPMPATVLLSLFLISVTGLQSTMQSALTFGSDTMFMFTAVLILAISIEETKLHNRLALLTLRAIGVSESRLILGFLLICGILSMWMSNTACTLMILPIAMAVSETLSDSDDSDEEASNIEKADQSLKISAEEIVELTHKSIEGEATVFVEVNQNTSEAVADEKRKTSTASKKKSRMPATPLCKALQLAIAYAANIGGMATLIGAYPNMVFKMTLEKLYGMDTGLNFLSYFVVCGPMSICSLLLTWIIFSTMYIPNWLCFWRRKHNPPPDYSRRIKALNKKIAELGKITQAEITVLILFSTVIILWLTRDPKIFAGWNVILPPKIATDSLPALLAAVLLFVLPQNYCHLWNGEYAPILRWKQVVLKFPWELMLFVGGITTITSVADSSGLITALGNAVPDLTGIPPIVTLAIICIAVSGLTECMSNSVITSILLPVLANVSEDMKINPIYFMLAVAMASQFAFMLPISAFPTLIVYNYGNVTVGEMAKSGIGPKIACLVFLIFSLEVTGGQVFDIKNFPIWAKDRFDARTLQGAVTAFSNATNVTAS